MITPKSALLFATVALSAVSSLGAPIPITRRDETAAVVQPIGRRYPQAFAADSPGLKARSVDTNTPSDAVVRRFPRRIYYEHYTRQAASEEVDPHARHYEYERSPAPEPEPAPAPVPEPESAEPVQAEARSAEQLAREALEARNKRRDSRKRDGSKDHFKRTLNVPGVRVRSPKEEPRSEKAARYNAQKNTREPAPIPETPVAPPAAEVREVAAPEKETRDAPAEPETREVKIESRAFIPPKPDVAQRDIYSWTIHTGDDIDMSTDVAVKGSCGCGTSAPSTSPCNQGTTGDPGSSNTPSTTVSSAPASTATTTDGSTSGCGCQGSNSTSTSTATDTSSTATVTSTTTASSIKATGTNTPNGSGEVPPPGGANGAGNSTTTHTTTASTSTATGKGNGQTGELSPNKPPISGRDESINAAEIANREAQPSDGVAPPQRRGSAKWRRITPAPSLKRSTTSGSSISFRRESN